jgi:hypothetical protein
MLAHGKAYADVIANDLAPGVNAIARTAALAHADAYRRFGKIAGVRCLAMQPGRWTCWRGSTSRAHARRWMR